MDKKWLWVLAFGIIVITLPLSAKSWRMKYRWPWSPKEGKLLLHIIPVFILWWLHIRYSSYGPAIFGLFWVLVFGMI